jgi:hypothetical protein
VDCYLTFINQYLESLFLSVEICLLLRNLSEYVEKYARHIVYSDDVNWYPEACKVLKLKQFIHSLMEKRIIERVNQYFKDRTESLDNYIYV